MLVSTKMARAAPPEERDYQGFVTIRPSKL
jgi:hypothetical protein